MDDTPADFTPANDTPPDFTPAAAGRVSIGDVERALEAIGARDSTRGGDARHIYDTLTWGEGPDVLSQAGVQNWLWYRLPTKYMTNEAGYKQRLACIAGELFDELGLGRYATICRSDATARVHAAFDRSDSAGYSAMRKAADASGIEPPDVDGFAWGTVMGGEEAAARTTVEHVLETAIVDGRLRVGANRWRDHQAGIVADVIHSDHPTLPGQTLRSVIHTERAGHWADLLVSRSPSIGPVVERALKQALVAPALPANDEITVALHPLLWFLERIGDGQAMTAAGYLNRSFVADVWANRPWTDELLPLKQPPRSESDDFILYLLRTFGQQTGVLRVTKRVLCRTKLADRIIADPAAAWKVVADHIAGTGWERFVAETAAMILVTNNATSPSKDLAKTIAQVAAGIGWRTDGHPPTETTVMHGFSQTRRLLCVFGMLTEHGDWRQRVYVLTDVGTRLADGIVHTAATGPRSHP